MPFYDIIYKQQNSHIHPVVFTQKADTMDEVWTAAERNKMLFWFIHTGDPGVPTKEEFSKLFQTTDEQELADIIEEWVNGNIEVTVELLEND